jgi:hypothetical protein
VINLDQGGEVAVRFGFDKQGEVQIEGYFALRNNGEFSADELRTLYLLASWESEVWHEDKPVAQLLQQYASQCGMNWGFNSPSDGNFYFSDQVSLVQALGNNLDQGSGGVEITDDPFGDLPELSVGPGGVISARNSPRE